MKKSRILILTFLLFMLVSENTLIAEEKTKWFKTRGYINLYNMETKTKEYKTEQKCNDAELNRWNETFYIGCKNGQFKFDGDLKNINGEKNYD